MSIVYGPRCESCGSIVLRTSATMKDPGVLLRKKTDETIVLREWDPKGDDQSVTRH